ncbi:MAG: hypothetical protein ACXVRS_15985 [Gaiellaceae bacterium]
MSIQVTIDTASKDGAALIAADLPGQPPAASWRGYGVIRLRVRREVEAKALLPLVGDCVDRHGLGWARVRIGDDQHMFRPRKTRAS